MDDEKFISKLNRILAADSIVLPVIQADMAPNGTALSQWASFLKICVKSGIKLSDPRWDRVTIERQKPVTVLALQNKEEKQDEPDFRVGLALLLGMLEEEDQKR